MSKWQVTSVGEWQWRPDSKGKFGEGFFIEDASKGAPAHAYCIIDNGTQRLSLELVFTDFGRYEVEGIVAFEPENSYISSSTLRQLPLSRLANEATTKLREYYGSTFGRGIKPIPTVPEHVINEWPRGNTSLVLEWVRDVYQAALNAGVPPTRTVSEQFGVSRDRAAYMVRRARELGVLQVSSENHPGKRTTKHAKKETTRRTDRDN